ncbi:MAG: efflux RND transporter periplasmic adaptor subunit [Myxococcota bacterium]
MSLRRAGTLTGLLVSALAVGCGTSTPEMEEAPHSRRVADPSLEVSTTLVQQGAITPRISVAGSLVARRESRIGPRVSGPLERIWVSEGDRVARGDALFQVERAAYLAALRKAEAGGDLLRAERRQVKADLERAKKLFAKQIIAKQDLDRLETQLAVAAARERQAVQAVAIAQRNLEDTLVRAPFSGSVAKRLADEGTTATPQTVVIVLQETGVLEARAAIAEGSHARIQVGDPARLYVEGIPDPLVSTVSAVSDTIDPDTRTYEVRITIPNPDHVYKSGIFVRVEIEPSSRTHVTLIPTDAIRRENGEDRVYVVRDGRAQPVAVQLGIVTERVAEVLDGVVPGDEIIVGDSVRLVSPGIKVHVTEREGSSA